MQPLSEFRRRFRRRVVNDLPLDLEMIEGEHVMDFLRIYVSPALAKLPVAGQRQQADAYRSYFSVPGMPPTSRQISPAGWRSFHFARNEIQSRSAAEFDDYATGKERQDRAIEPAKVRITSAIAAHRRRIGMPMRSTMAAKVPLRPSNG